MVTNLYEYDISGHKRLPYQVKKCPKLVKGFLKQLLYSVLQNELTISSDKSHHSLQFKSNED